MLRAILEAVSTLGPIVLFMLIPVLIPVFTLTAGAIFDRVKGPKIPASARDSAHD